MSSGALKIAILSPPFGEVWIEIRMLKLGYPWTFGHLPSGRCGLKYRSDELATRVQGSPPFGEVWIEIDGCRILVARLGVTSLRGGVD